MDRIARVDAPLHVIRVTSRTFASNAYLIATGTDHGCFLIDPGLDRDSIDEALRQHALVPRVILCTHGHFDHLGSAKHFQSHYKAPVYLHAADLPTARSSNFLLMAMRLPHRITIPTIDGDVHHGFAVTLDGLDARFLSTPGHTPGSCVIQLAGMAFTGDTLYGRGIGLSGLPGENTRQLKETLRRLLEVLPDDVLVLPGHGLESSLEAIKRLNLPLAKFLHSADVGAGHGH